MAALIDVRSNLSDVLNFMGEAQRQIRFATGNALNDTAFQAQKAVKKHIRKRLDLKNKWTERGIRVKKAARRGGAGGRKLRAKVFVAEGRQYLSIQQTGGVKRPKGKHLAVPFNQKRTKRGKIAKGRRPRALLDKENFFKVEHGNKSRLAPGIYQRYKNSRRAPKMIYPHPNPIEGPVKHELLQQLTALQ